MKIRLTFGVGEGPTSLAAFDSALFNAGVANYNLIKLSSVIPQNAEIIVGKIDWNQKEYGNKLYVVASYKIAKKIGDEAWAGLGWIQDSVGKGLFVEHKGKSKATVNNLIHKTLTNMQAYRPEKYGKIQDKTIGIKCKKNPVCAFILAVYQSENW